MASNYLGYQEKSSPIHRLSGTTKLICFLVLSIICMVSYDTRFLFISGVVALIVLKISKIRWQEIKYPTYFILVFAVINLLMIFVFSPEEGVKIYHYRTVISHLVGPYWLTKEQLFYELNILLKYFSTIPLAFIFILTTHPSELAASFNHIGVSYRISYAIALALRYIPDIQADFDAIRQAQQAKGIDMSRKAPLLQRLKHSAKIIMPLIFNSLDRIDMISQSMELRRFGKGNKRTWYSYRPFSKGDLLAISFVTILSIIGIALFFINQGRFYNPF